MVFMSFYVTITFHKSLFIYISCVAMTGCDAVACYLASHWSVRPWVTCEGVVHLDNSGVGSYR